LFSPVLQFLIHGLDILINKFDGFAKRGGVLADGLNHGFDKIQLFLCELSGGDDFL
jgi:hypothetical protein